MKNIYLIGLSGSGKSTVGKVLALKLECTFVDMDKMIEKSAGKSIARIFKDDGELKFRLLETAALRKLARKTSRPKVIALGGGALESAVNRKLVSVSGISIWLRCSASELSNRLKNKSDRPLLKGHNLTRPLRAQLKKRQKHYRTAQLHVSTSGKKPRQVSIEIMNSLRKQYAAD